MSKKITLLFIQLSESYFFLIALALGFGLLFPQRAEALNPYTEFFLQIIFFLTSLKLDPRETFRQAKDFKMLLFANVAMLVIFPVIVFFITEAFLPSLQLPLLLLAAMPSGMTSPLLTEVVGGKVGLGVILTLTTSLLAPLTIPLVLFLFAKTAVMVNFFSMFWNLFTIIVIPFLLAQGFRRLLGKNLRVTFFTFKPISLILLGLLIAGVVGKQAEFILENFASKALMTLIALSVFLSTIAVAGYFVVPWKTREERMTISICLTFMNFTLAIYIAGTFFSDPDMLLASVLVIFPWALLIYPLKIVSQKFLRIT